MKKTIRAIVTALLIAILSLAIGTAAFAANAEIEWYESENAPAVSTYMYGGKELEEGETKLFSFDEDLRYYDFEVKNSGYYGISTEKGSWIRLPQTFNGSYAQNTLEEIAHTEDRRLYYLEKGETVIGLNFYGEANDTISIEYLGEEVVDFTIDEKELECLIIGTEVWECNMEYIGVVSDTVLTFSSGKTYEICYYFEGTCNPVPKTGKNTATFEFCGVEKDFEFTAYYITDIIKSAEISNPYRYTKLEMDYRGNEHEVFYHDLTEEILTVTFNDGTEYKTKVEYDYTDIVLPCGKTVSAYIGIIENDNGETVFGIRITGTLITEYEVEYQEISFKENFNIFNQDNMDALDNAKACFIRAFENLESNPDYANLNISWSIFAIGEIILNMVNFIKFYSVIF